MDQNKIPTTCFSDVFNGNGELDYRIQPLNPHSQMIGPAYTVQLPFGDNLDLIQAILMAPKGSVLVVNSSNNLKTAIIGDNYSAAAKELGILGIVTDGIVRDYQEIIDLDFPIFCKGHGTLSPTKKGGGVKEVTLELGGVTVRPGDIIIGDRNGVISIPSEEYETLIAKADQKNIKDQEVGLKIKNEPDYARRYLEGLVQKFSK